VVAPTSGSTSARARSRGGGDKSSRSVVRPRVRGSRTSRPIMRLLDLLSRRWSLRVIWELRGELMTSRELRIACGDLSPTVLQSRLTELRRVELVQLETGGGYRLSGQGRELLNLLLPLHFFAEHWAKQLLAEDRLGAR
jgi:DNA-binding HxlR family transcriptional regulator